MGRFCQKGGKIIWQISYFTLKNLWFIKNVKGFLKDLNIFIIFLKNMWRAEPLNNSNVTQILPH